MQCCWPKRYATCFYCTSSLIVHSTVHHVCNSSCYLGPSHRVTWHGRVQNDRSYQDHKLGHKSQWGLRMHQPTKVDLFSSVETCQTEIACSNGYPAAQSTLRVLRECLPSYTTELRAFVCCDGHLSYSQPEFCKFIFRTGVPYRSGPSSKIVMCRSIVFSTLRIQNTECRSELLGYCDKWLAKAELLTEVKKAQYSNRAWQAAFKTGCQRSSHAFSICNLSF